MIRFTLDQLEVLNACVELGSFTAAAERLHRATSAVSYAIKTLEDALGVELFDRSGKQARLTPAGELVLTKARAVIAQAKQVELTASDLSKGWEAHLRVVIDGALPTRPIVAAAKRFVQRDLPTEVRMMTEYLSGVRRRFDREQAHMMLVVEYPGDASYVCINLPRIEMVLVAHRDHPIHRSGKRLDREAMAKHIEVLVADSGDRSAPPPTSTACIGSPRVYEVTDFRAKQQALLEGIGYGYLPSHLLGGSKAKSLLKPLAFEEGTSYTLTPRVMYRRDEPVGPAASAFLQDLLEAFGVTPSGIGQSS